jgi:hypothetical protein
MDDMIDVYRINSSKERAAAELEMREACQLLYDWRKHRPAIAGGALWAWAAQEPPRDIDIFLRHSFFRPVHRKARQLYGEPLNYPFGPPYEDYGGLMRNLPSARYSTFLPQSRARVDFVVAKWTGFQAVAAFDWEHCQVAFSPTGRVTLGTDSYARGELARNQQAARGHQVARDRQVVEEKLQTSLWGKPWAPRCLLDVMDKLEQIYDQIATPSE